jgi:uncharacterized membrane protein
MAPVNCDGLIAWPGLGRATGTRGAVDGPAASARATIYYSRYPGQNGSKEANMATLIIGLAVFLGMHSISIVSPALRARAVAAMGFNVWRGLYSLVSVAGFVLIVYGFGLARQDPVVLYVPPVWTRHLTFILMLPVFPLLLAAYLPGRISTAMKHPMLAAVKFWAVAHLLSVGLLADVLLFGAFLAWAVFDRLSFRHRPPQVIKRAPEGRLNDVVAVFVGLGLYVFFIVWAHLKLFGVAPMG